MKKILGVLLIIIGTILILGYMYNWKAQIWPISFLILGVFFFVIASKTRYMLYIPAIVLTFSSLFFIYNILTNWQNFNKLWPTLILLFSLSFIISAIIGKQKELFLPGFIVLAVSICLFFISFNIFKFWPIILIILGLWVLIDKKNFKNQI